MLAQAFIFRYACGRNGGCLRKLSSKGDDKGHEKKSRRSSDGSYAREEAFACPPQGNCHEGSRSEMGEKGRLAGPETFLRKSRWSAHCRQMPAKTRLHLALTLLVCTRAVADPPDCRINGEFDVCSRNEANCDAVETQLKNPSPAFNIGPTWKGCWPATIIRGHPIIGGLIFFTAYVSVVPRYHDSERMDILITVELAGGGRREYVRKGVPIIIRNGFASASTDVSASEPIMGVPTVVATEIGGAVEVRHAYP